MNSSIEVFASGVFMGVAGSTAIDLYALVLRRLFRVPTLDYALLGRWIGHFPRGRFAHTRITDAEPIRGERALGWIAHHSIGIGFAFGLLALVGSGWLRSPTLLPPLLVGLGTVAAPWFVMQPAFGMGIAGSKTARPLAGRLRNLGTHAAFGLGLYLASLIVGILLR